MSECTSCLENYKDICGTYTGPDYDCVNVKNGDNLSKVLKNIMDKLCEEVEDAPCNDCGEKSELSE